MNQLTNPIQLFKTWYKAELKLSKVQIPTAVCFSTIGLDNFPNARFVSLKEIIDDNLIITGSLKSRKGIEVNQNNKVALTFWWTETERQVRIQGEANKISEVLATKYFDERSQISKVISEVCNQGKVVENVSVLQEKVETFIRKNKKIDKPKDWSGLSIKPIRIEFMEFKTSRFHDRKLYELVDGEWKMTKIQP